ncbi:diaminopimelate epimerase [Anaerospora sp.]|jgi:diaminopimelate epimerase|uniref:diaminopimelate epimerase n=1 Tax=Anaerospora sp. TaxID=1960278 RepID=UPI00289F83BB|nr:diaminopimelate epimerase [Anaerospora sp.]MDF2928064.1 Diaminopimelate epimerase [Anaerospora sp.]
MQFSKWHGQGNDFVIVNGFQEKLNDYRQAAIAVCDRHFGIGADGLVILLPAATADADFKIRIFNSDGSEAEMCGNATRCIARYVYENGLTEKTSLTLETLAGYIKPEIVFETGQIKTICVDMGVPRLQRSEIPMAGSDDLQAVNIPLEAAGGTYGITCVSMGNPHCVIFVEDITAVDLSAIGPVIETHSLFPRKTNVEFVQVLSSNKVRMRVWERGAGVTLACGTGASATLVASVLNGKTDRAITVNLDGGDLFVEWRDDNHIYMSGPAIEVFRGSYLGRV